MGRASPQTGLYLLSFCLGLSPRLVLALLVGTKHVRKQPSDGARGTARWGCWAFLTTSVLPGGFFPAWGQETQALPFSPLSPGKLGPFCRAITSHPQQWDELCRHSPAASEPGAHLKSSFLDFVFIIPEQQHERLPLRAQVNVSSWL